MILEMRNEKMVRTKLFMWVVKPLIDRRKVPVTDRDRNRSPRLLFQKADASWRNTILVPYRCNTLFFNLPFSFDAPKASMLSSFFSSG
jgi:hypothetical protein